MRFLSLALPLAGLFSPVFLPATSIVPFANMGEATTYTECVVLARAVEQVATVKNGTTFRDTRFESVESVKGPLAAGTGFNIRSLSCQTEGYSIYIAGDFAPQIGKTYLLFLYKKEEVWMPVMLSYYVFEQFEVGGDKFLAPIGDKGIEALSRPDGQAVEPLGTFRQDVFLQQLRSFAASPGSVWDGSLGRSLFQMEGLASSERAIPAGCDFTLGGVLARWPDAAVPVYYDDTANPPGWGGTFSNVLSAMNSEYVGIDPSDAGSAAYVPDCASGHAYSGNFLDFCDSDLNGSQSTLIIFDDPCNEITDLNNCSGTLAIGGSYTSSTTHQFDNLSWHDALYGFVIVNNGTPSCLTSAQFEMMMTHELTHSYHMGHITNPPTGQNMNPSCCNPIANKDRECMNYAYPAPAPVELVSYEARLHGERQVKLYWATEVERDNAHFTIHRSGTGTQYDQIMQLPSKGNGLGAHYEWLDAKPLAGTNYYLLSQADFDGTVQHLGIKAVTVGNSEHILSIAPNPVAGETLVFSMELSNDFDGQLEVLAADGRVVSSSSLALEKGNQYLQQPLGDLPTGVYLLRLFGGQEQWSARFLKK